MKTLDIYRYEIETPNGKFIGPYNASDKFDNNNLEEIYNKLYSLRSKLLNAHSSKKRPDIENDVNINYFNSLYYCGCDSEIKLLKWFNKFNTEIKEAGFKLVKYNLLEKDVLLGRSKKQCAFNISNVITRTEIN